MNSAALSILRHSGAVRTYVYIIADLRVSFKYGNPAFLRFLRFFRLNPAAAAHMCLLGQGGHFFPADFFPFFSFFSRRSGPYGFPADITCRNMS